MLSSSFRTSLSSRTKNAYRNVRKKPYADYDLCPRPTAWAQVKKNPTQINTAAKRTAHEYDFELPVDTHLRLCIKIQCKQDKIPYREVQKYRELYLPTQIRFLIGEERVIGQNFVTP